MTVKELQDKLHCLMVDLDEYSDSTRIHVAVLDEDGNWIVPSFSEPFIEENRDGSISLNIY